MAKNNRDNINSNKLNQKSSSIKDRLFSLFRGNKISDGTRQVEKAKSNLNNNLNYRNQQNQQNQQNQEIRRFSLPYTPIDVHNTLSNLNLNQDNFANYGNQPPGISGEYLSSGTSSSYGYNSNGYNEQEMRAKVGLYNRLKEAYHVLMGHDTKNPNNSNPNSSPGQPINSYTGTQKHSPSLDRYNRDYYEPAERRAIIGQIMELIAQNPVIDAAIRKFANGSVDAGWIVSVTYAMRGEAQLKQAQIALDRLKDLCSLEYLLPSVAYDMVAYGDAFLQIVINNETKEIDEIKQMPVATMERRTDDRDNWINPDEAFLQRDTNNQAITGKFVEGQIIHARHLYTPGHRYGKSQIYSGRGIAKDALDAMKSLLSRRLANMPFRHLDVSGIDGGGVSDTQFQDFMKNTSRKIAIADGRGVSPWDDLYTNGVSVDVIGGDSNLGTTEDIDMQLDSVLALVGVSRQLLGWGTTINRDVLDEQRSELYAAQAQFVKSLTHQVLMPLFKTALILQGIDHREIKISVEYAQSLTNLELQRRLEQARKDYVTGGMQHKSYVKVCGAYYGFENVDRELEAIDKERGTSQPPGLSALSMPGLGGSKSQIPAGENSSIQSVKASEQIKLNKDSNKDFNQPRLDNVIPFENSKTDEVDDILGELSVEQIAVLTNKLFNFAKNNQNKVTSKPKKTKKY